MLLSPSRLQEQKTKRAMNLSVNGQSQVPPGFRFHPTEEELLQYYLKKKVASLQIDLDVIQDIDLNKLEPWDIQEKCRIGSAPQTDWYFFSHKDKKYPTGTRTNRATAAGFWKATGRDKVICSSSSRIGMRKTLVFYTGRAPHGEKSDWIMHEYRLDDNTLDHNGSNLINGDQSGAAEEGWVVCRVFRKKNYVKALDSPANCSSKTSMDLRTHMLNSPTHDLDHILSYMGKTTTTTTTNAAASTTKEESKRSLPSNAYTKTTNMRYLELDHMESFMHLPQLETPIDQHDQMMINYAPAPSASTWAELDRLVAYQLNGQASVEVNSESTKQLSCLKNNSTADNSIMPFCFTGDADTTTATATATTTTTTTLEHLLHSQSSRVYDDQFWSFTKQSSSSTSLDPILHFSV